MSRLRQVLGHPVPLWIVLALGVSILVWSYNLQHANWDDDIATCERSNAGRVDVIARDGDLALFAEQAAAVRHKDGQHRVARGYERIAVRSRIRQVRTKGRIVDCPATYPEPSLLPF